MPGLLIRIANGQWVASVANANISYNFVGATLNQQVGSVQTLAFNMTDAAQGALAQNIGNALVLPNGVQGAQVVTELFNTTDLLIFNGNVIYGTVEGMVLNDALDEAGTALMAALIA
jgi:hypothetical protein